MAKQAIGLGTLADDGTGDTLRVALDKVNDNFDEVYDFLTGTGAVTLASMVTGPATLGDTIITDTTPILIFKDSSCTDADNNATITVNATTTTTNLEDIDVIVASQIGGVSTTFLNADADGSITLGDATRPIVLSGAVTAGDLSISDATPVLNFKDTSCAVARVNALIKTDATDVGDGTEDADVTFQQMVAGTAATFLVSDADGSLTLGQTAQHIVLNGTVGDVTLYDTTPVLSLIDSDSADKDAGVSLTATCTTTTAGSEHVDATFAQQVAGSPVTFLLADADGAITLGDATRAVVLSGPVGDTLFKSAAPTLTFTDSSCTDADVNASIAVSATTTTTNAEDVDVTFSQQVGGVLTAFLTADANGVLTLGQPTQTVYAPKLTSGRGVTAVTTTAAPAATLTGTVYTNEGDADGSTITLPLAAAGLQFTFVVQANAMMNIMANTGDTIRWLTDVTAAAGGIKCTTVGSTITLTAINAIEWVATSIVGTWVVVV